MQQIYFLLQHICKVAQLPQIHAIRNLDKLKLHLDSLNHSFSIVAISESWLTSTNKNLYHMKGYTHKYEIREHRAGGGVSLFINNDIRYEIRSDIKFNVDDVNTLFIEIPNNSIKSKKILSWESVTAHLKYVSVNLSKNCTPSWRNCTI